MKTIRLKKYQGGWVGAAIGAGASVLGGMMTSNGQSSANSANNAQAVRQMAFQQYMASHAHGIEMNDLRRSGLNPILTATGGRGAAVPSGASANIENAAGAGVSSALSALSTISSAMRTNAETDKVKAETEYTIARTNTERLQPNRTAADIALTREQTTNAITARQNMEADTRLKELGAQVSMSEVNKNNELTDLFRKQGFTQDQQTRLLSVNVQQANQVLEQMLNAGAIDRSTYGKFLQYIDRTLETVGKGVGLFGKSRIGRQDLPPARRR